MGKNRNGEASYGYPEECYFDYTLSPIIAADGSVAGIFVSMMLEMVSYHVASTLNGEVMPVAVEKEHSDLILLDVWSRRPGNLQKFEKQYIYPKYSVTDDFCQQRCKTISFECQRRWFSGKTF